jgi:hypothetical protein
MLSAEKITREELYEAVWSEPIHQLSKALGISDVGLAKVCKKLNVPVPGRGYWAKNRATRKLLRISLPYLEAGQPTEHRITQAHCGEADRWTRETIQYLAGEGVNVPTIAESTIEPELHPLLAQYREMLEQSGLNAGRLRATQPCLAINVSPSLLERALKIFQDLFSAFEKQGYQVEVLPPGSDQFSYGYRAAKPSRTVVKILGVPVAFELEEDYRTVHVPVTPAPRNQRPLAYEDRPVPEYRNEGTGQLKLAITGSYARGIRVSWKDGKRLRIEDQLDAFLLSAVALAEQAHRDRLEQERLQRKAQEARALAAAKAAEEKKLAQHLFDLDSRVRDCQQAEQIRAFLQKARLRRAGGGEQAMPSAELKAWFDWAESQADELESEALGTLLNFRKLPDTPPTSSPQGETRDLESRLQHQVALWHQRFVYGRR